MTRGRASRFGAAGLALALLAAACAHVPPGWDALPSRGAVGDTARYGAGLVTLDTASGTVRFALAQPAEVVLVAVTGDGRVTPLYPRAPDESSAFTAGPHTVSIPLSLEWVPDPGGPAPAGAVGVLDAQRAYERCVATYMPRRGAGREAAQADTTRRGQSQPVPTPEPVGAVASSCGRPPVPSLSAAGHPGSFRARNDLVVLVASHTALSAAELRRRVRHLRIRTTGDLEVLPLRVAGDRELPWAGYYSRRF